MWPLPLAAGEHFTLYLMAGNRQIAAGDVAQPVFGSRYVLSADARGVLGALSSATGEPVAYDWLVRLEDGRGQVIAESERRAVAFAPDPAAALATAEASPTTVIVTATPPAPTPTTTTTPPPTPEPPSNELPPVVVTATPQPSPMP
jgi:hypothetical protein